VREEDIKFKDHPLFKLLEKIAKKKFDSTSMANTIVMRCYGAAQHAQTEEHLEEVLYQCIDMLCIGYDETTEILHEYYIRMPQTKVQK